MTICWCRGNKCVTARSIGAGSTSSRPRRLIAVKGKMFGRDVSEINLANIEYVDAKKGFLSSKGSIVIGSSSGNRDLEFDNVPNVLEFRRELLEAVDDRQG